MIAVPVASSPTVTIPPLDTDTSALLDDHVTVCGALPVTSTITPKLVVESGATVNVAGTTVTLITLSVAGVPPPPTVNVQVPLLVPSATLVAVIVTTVPSATAPTVTIPPLVTVTPSLFVDHSTALLAKPSVSTSAVNTNDVLAPLDTTDGLTDTPNTLEVLGTNTTA